MKITPLPNRVVVLAVAISLVVGVASFAFAAADPALIARARRTLYTTREQSIELLENAVKQHPEEPAYWAELINALDVDSETTFAERASRQALKLHPHQPDLLIARARMHRDGEGLEALAELATVPGYQAIAAKYSDWATCSFGLPDGDVWPPESSIALADRLIVLGRTVDAARYLGEALTTAEGEVAGQILARQAMLSALDGKFETAMLLHAKAGGVFIRIEYSYYGLADVLLAMKKPDLAIKAVGDRPLDQPEQADDRRILATAKSRSHDLDGALKLLAGDDQEDQLLRCRALLLAGREDDAKALAAKIVNTIKTQPPQWGGPRVFSELGGPISLIDDWLFIVGWLNDQFPADRPMIESAWGTGKEKPDSRSSGWFVEPLSKAIPRLQTALQAIDPKDDQAEFQARRALSDAYELAGRYADAAAVLTVLPPTEYQEKVSFAWMRWSILRREAEAAAASEKDYAALAAARPLIARAVAIGFLSNSEDRKLGVPDDAVVKQVVAMGPAVLADVLIGLGPNTAAGQDRRMFVAVIQQLGSIEDAPAVIRTLCLVSRDEKYLNARQHENDHVTADALDACLQKITGENPEGADRAQAWSHWWAKNHARIAKR